MIQEKVKLDLASSIRWDKITNPATHEIIEKIQQAAEENLQHWKTFPITLPPSIVDNKSVCLQDLFILPAFDELDALTTDAKGNPKYLIYNQLQSIKRKGQFTVPSTNFPGQSHVWKLNPIFQKGIETAREEYLDGIAFALRFVTIYAVELILGNPEKQQHQQHCLLQCLRSMRNDLTEVIDLVIGFGKVYVPNLERSIHEERCKFLVAELKCKGDGARQVGRYVRNQWTKAMREKVTLAMERPPPIPYRFTTPVSLDVDLRLFDRDLFRKVGQPLGRILEKCSRGWFLSFRETVIAELKNRKTNESEIEAEANLMVTDEYLRRVYNAVLTCAEVRSMGSEVDKLLMEQGHFYVLMHRAVDNVELKLESYLRDKKKYVHGKYPILSRDPVWMTTHMKRIQAKFCEENGWLPHEMSLELCQQQELKQHKYFLQRDLAFMRDTAPVLRKELESDKIPCRTYEWKALKWKPENYVINRSLHGQEEIVPTIVSKTPTSITSPRTDSNHPIYTMERMTSRYTTSRWPFWRVTNMIFRTLTWILNAMYFLGYVIPWSSPVSIRAIFSPRPFLADLELSQVNGTLCPQKSSQVETLTSRLTSIWRHVSKARTKFESKPDIGLLGKGWSRFVNRFWNIVIKGILPSAALIVGFPIVALFVSTMSFLLAISTPIWVPFAVIAFHIVCIFVYDFDCPHSEKMKYGSIFLIVGSFLANGLGKGLLCIFGAGIISPLITGLIVIWTIINYGVRIAWDSLVFYAVIKPNGRLPAGDTWVVKRIMGPGFSPDFYFEISVEQALIAFQIRLETDELNIFYQKTNQTITQPQIDFKSFMTAIFSPFSAKLVETEGPYRDLIQETQILRASLEDKVIRRRHELETSLNVETRSRIKMRKPLLERALLIACKMAQTFYPEHVFSRMIEGEVANFWESRGLETYDWMNLTLNLFGEIFSQDFLTPLEESDICFNLEMRIKRNPLSSELFIESVEDDFWRSEVPITMSKVKYQIHSPFLDVSAFNPMIRSSQVGEDPLTRNFSIPIPILHPAYISVIIHNRETEHPFAIEHPVCQAILKALQDSGPALNQDCVSLNLGSSFSSSDDLDRDSGEVGSGSDDFVQINIDDNTLPLRLPGSSGSFDRGEGPIRQHHSNHHDPLQRGTVSASGSRKPTPSLPNKFRQGSGSSVMKHDENHASKASLASPEELTLEVIHGPLGTSV